MGRSGKFVKGAAAKRTTHPGRLTRKQVEKMNAAKEKRLKFLEEARKCDERVVKMVNEARKREAEKLLVSPYRYEVAEPGSVLGYQLPLRVLFMPDQFCRTYDNQTIMLSTNMSKLAHFILLNPYLPHGDEIALLCEYLTVCTDEWLASSLMPFVEHVMKSGRYCPQWKSVQGILHNLGFIGEPKQFDSYSYYAIKTPNGIPQEWNFRVLLHLIHHGFGKWEHKFLLALVTFLCDCLFEVRLLELQNEICLILCDVASFLMDHGHTVDDLAMLLSQSHVSVKCNRHVVIQLSGDPRMREVSARVGFNTVFDLLKTDSQNRIYSLRCVSQLLIDFTQSSGVMGLQDIQELAILAETLVCRDLFGEESQHFLTVLCDFVSYVHHRTHPEMKHLVGDIVIRLKVVASLPSVAEDVGLVCHINGDRVNVSGPTYSPVTRFLDDRVVVTCKYCSQWYDNFPPATVLFRKMMELLELKGLYKLFHSVLPVMSTYVAEEVMVSSFMINFLLTNLCEINDVLCKLQVRSFLESHLSFHPPCRPAMRQYYLHVLTCDLTYAKSPLGDKCKPFFTFLETLKAALREPSTVSSPVELNEEVSTAEEALRAIVKSSHAVEGSTKPKRSDIHFLMLTFRYFVDILCHDFSACSHTGHVPLLVHVVWGNVDNVRMNSHCADIIDMYLAAPRMWRHQLGRYLTLLASTLQKDVASSEDLFLPIHSNSLVDALIRKIMELNDSHALVELIGDIPSNAFRCQLLQGVLFQHLVMGASQAAQTSHDPISNVSRKRGTCPATISPVNIDSDSSPERRGDSLRPSLTDHPSWLSPLKSGMWLDNHIIDTAICNLIVHHKKHNSVAFIPNMAFEPLSNCKDNAHGQYKELVRYIAAIDSPSTKEFVLMSRRVNENHWILGVVCVRSKHILILDPLYNDVRDDNLPAARIFMKVALACSVVGNEPFDESQWCIGSYELREKQPNGFDCGLFSIYHATMFMDSDLTIFSDLAIGCNGQIIDSDQGRMKVFHLLNMPSARTKRSRCYTVDEITAWCVTLDGYTPTLLVAKKPITRPSVWGNLCQRSHIEKIDFSVPGSAGYPFTVRAAASSKCDHTYATSSDVSCKDLYPYTGSFECLNDSQWLWVEIIEQAIERLIWKHDKSCSVQLLIGATLGCLQMTSTPFDRHYNLLISLDIHEALNKEFLITVIHANGNHWVLGVLVFRSKHILILDSLSPRRCSQHLSHAKVLLKVAYSCYLVAGLPFKEAEWVVRPYEHCAEQKNVVDCGLFVIYNSTLFFDRDRSLFAGFALQGDGRIVDSPVGRRKVYDLLNETIPPSQPPLTNRTFSDKELTLLSTVVDEYTPKCLPRRRGQYDIPVSSTTVWGHDDWELSNFRCGLRDECVVKDGDPDSSRDLRMCVICRKRWHRVCRVRVVTPREYVVYGKYFVCHHCYPKTL